MVKVLFTGYYPDNKAGYMNIATNDPIDAIKRVAHNLGCHGAPDRKYIRCGTNALWGAVWFQTEYRILSRIHIFVSARNIKIKRRRLR